MYSMMTGMECVIQGSPKGVAVTVKPQSGIPPTKALLNKLVESCCYRRTRSFGSASQNTEPLLYKSWLIVKINVFQNCVLCEAPFKLLINKVENTFSKKKKNSEPAANANCILEYK